MSQVRKKNKDLPSGVYFKCGAYYWVFYENKKKKWVRLHKNKYRALDIWNQLNERKETNPDKITMSHVFLKYMIEVAPGKAKTTFVANEHQMKPLHIYFGHMRPDQIKPVHIYQYIDARSATPFAANREIALLSHVFTKCIRWGFAERNPCLGIERLKEPRRDRLVTNEEFEAVYSLSNPSIQCAMDIAMAIGARKNDILSISIKNVTPDGVKLFVSKINKHFVYIPNKDFTEVIEKAFAVRKKFARTFSPDNLILNKFGQAYNPDYFTKEFTRNVKRAIKKGLIESPFTFRDLRPKFITEVSNEDGIDYAQKIVGHATQKMTRHYLRGDIKIKLPDKN